MSCVVGNANKSHSTNLTLLGPCYLTLLRAAARYPTRLPSPPHANSRYSTPTPLPTAPIGPCLHRVDLWYGGPEGVHCAALAVSQGVKVFVLTQFSNDVRIYDTDGSVTHVDLADINPRPTDIVIEFVHGNHFDSFMNGR